MNKLREKIAKEAGLPVEKIKCCPYCGRPFKDENVCSFPSCKGCKYEKDAPSEEHCFGCARMYGDHFKKADESE